MLLNKLVTFQQCRVYGRSKKRWKLPVWESTEFRIHLFIYKSRLFGTLVDLMLKAISTSESSRESLRSASMPYLIGMFFFSKYEINCMIFCIIISLTHQILIFYLCCRFFVCVLLFCIHKPIFLIRNMILTKITIVLAPTIEINIFITH